MSKTPSRRPRASTGKVAPRKGKKDSAAGGEIAKSPKAEVLQAGPEATIEAACQEITGILQKTFFRGTINVGLYVLKTFFDNDPDVARSYRWGKNASFRALTERCGTPVLPVSKSWLHNAVGLAILNRELAGSCEAWGQLLPTHQVRLLPVRDPGKIVALANEAIEKNFSTRELKDRVAEVVARQEKHPGGRRPINPVLRTLARATRSLERDGRGLIARKSDLGKLSDEDARAALKTAQALASRLRDWVEKLEERLKS